MLYLLELHNHAMVIILRVLLIISYSISFNFANKFYHKYLAEGVFIETVWSIVPSFLLVALVIPSIKILY